MLLQIKSKTHVAITFDGHVVELFPVNGGSERIHIWSITAADLTTDRRGRHILTIQHTPANRKHGSAIDEADLEAARQFVAAIQAKGQ